MGGDEEAGHVRNHEMVGLALLELASEGVFSAIDAEITGQHITELERKLQPESLGPMAIDGFFNNGHSDLGKLFSNAQDLAQSFREPTDSTAAESQNQATRNHRRWHIERLLSGAAWDIWSGEVPPLDESIWDDDDEDDAPQRQTMYIAYLLLWYRLEVMGRALLQEDADNRRKPFTH